MARDVESIFPVSDIWALTGDKAPPGFPLNTGWGPIYEQDPNLGGAFLSRDTFNQNFYRLTLLANLTTTYGGGLEWDSTINYVKGALAVGSTGDLFFSKVANINIDPVPDGGFNWGNISELGSSVTSVFGRAGPAIVAVSGDYDAPKVNYANSTGFLESGDTDVDLAVNRLADFAATVGQVKINTGNSLMPVTSNVAPAAGIPSPSQIFNYDLPLGISSSPTTTWPRMVSSPVDADIWDNINTSFVENLSLGQVNEWRFIFSFVKTGAPSSKFIINIMLGNPLSGFSLTHEIYVSEEISSGDFIFQFKTIADSASLPTPLGTGQGYQLESFIIGDINSECDITLESSTRHSTYNTYVSP